MLLRCYLTNKLFNLLVLLLSIFSKILASLSATAESETCNVLWIRTILQPWLLLTFYYLKNFLCYPFIWGCKSKSRFISLQNFIAKILNYFVSKPYLIMRKNYLFFERAAKITRDTLLYKFFCFLLCSFNF